METSPAPANPLENDTVVLPVSYYNPLTETMTHASVSYHIERGDGSPRLVRQLEGGFGVEKPGGAIEPVAKGVMSMRIDYFDGAEWLPQWRQLEHPDAVRVSLTLQSPFRPDEQISRKSAFAIRVR